MKKLFALYLIGVFFSCSSNSSVDSKGLATQSDTLIQVSFDTTDSMSVTKKIELSVDKASEKNVNDRILLDFDQNVLTETSINGLKLPFKPIEMIDRIKVAFQGYDVKKKIGQQDGPDFPFYSIMKGSEQILFMAMSSLDTLELSKIYIQSPEMSDQYGQ